MTKIIMIVLVALLLAFVIICYVPLNVLTGSCNMQELGGPDGAGTWLSFRNCEVYLHRDLPDGRVTDVKIGTYKSDLSGKYIVTWIKTGNETQVIPYLLWYRLLNPGNNGTIKLRKPFWIN